jgi:protease-4
MSFAKIQELRGKLQEFTAAGKFCTAYLEAGTNINYYLASACPEVYLTPTSGLGLHALMGHATFLRGTLDKLDIQANFERIGEYKNAPNRYTERRFTPEHREVVTSLLTTWQQQLIDDVAESRQLEPDRLGELIRSGPFLAQEAVDNQLVDKLLYPDEYRDLLKQKAGVSELKTLSVDTYLERSASRTGPEIAIVHATGDIVPGPSGYHPSVGRFMGAKTVSEGLRAARKDDCSASTAPVVSTSPQRSSDVRLPWPKRRSRWWCRCRMWLPPVATTSPCRPTRLWPTGVR